MWRAVFAIAHTDGRVSPEEIDFAQNYLKNAPFSSEQKEILLTDLRDPQDVKAMLAGVPDLADQADFFQFATMLGWSDSDYNEAERKVIGRLSEAQMARFNKDDIARKIRDSRKAAILRRAVEDEEFAGQARDVSSLANIIRFVMPWMDARTMEPPDAEMFALWRAVFSLVHADNEVTDEERDYIEGMMQVFRFSEEQRAVVARDLLEAQDVVVFFNALKSERHQKQFFVMARTVLWCDGEFQEEEQAAVERLKAALGNRAESFNQELQWLTRKPATGDGEEWETGEEAMMKGVVRQMLDFYRGEVL
ncbi:MAG: TerB family tellurite resistance protein [Alphaproteobacteria bacterium]|nr:TerB family tellurite resistance protein [Alphaproteobacteria bacterium]